MNSTLGESRISTRPTAQVKNVGAIPSCILSEFLFFFLDVEDLTKNLFNVNKNWLEAYKTHLNVRIYLLSEETKAYEEMNVDIVEGIREKRLQFYQDYEMEAPSKELAVRLLESLDHKSISVLKRV